MRVSPKLRGDDAHLVTQARRSRSDDIAYRQRRYLIMMSVRVVCFGLAIVLFTQGAGWVAAIPAVLAIGLPYIAVVFANGGREPAKVRGFREYEPNLPVSSSQPRAERMVRPGQPEQAGDVAPEPGSPAGRPVTGDQAARTPAAGSPPNS